MQKTSQRSEVLSNCMEQCVSNYNRSEGKAEDKMLRFVVNELNDVAEDGFYWVFLHVAEVRPCHLGPSPMPMPSVCCLVTFVILPSGL